MKCYLNKAELKKKLEAQQKTIEVLMDTVEQQSAEGVSRLALMSQNLNLEKVVQRKTENLRQQGEQLQKALYDLQMTQAQLLQTNKLEAVGRLAAGIAHEINTPAQFIGSNIDFLDDSFRSLGQLVDTMERWMQAVSQGTAAPGSMEEAQNILTEMDWDYLREEIPAALRQSKEGIKRITTIVHAMKEFSHPSSKEMVANNINQLLETTVIVATNEWKYFADIHTDLAPELPLVQSLADELAQVFLNILVNAAHAVEAKLKDHAVTEKGRITLATCQVDQHTVEVRISDTGTGIPEAIRNRIFDPFFTTKAVGKGTGQGLAIAYDTVTRKHGGAITFASETGVGTTFFIRLPITKAEKGKGPDGMAA